MAKRFSWRPWQAAQHKLSGSALRSADEFDASIPEEASGDRSNPAPSRWSDDTQSDLSPYGFSEEDGGLRQVESGAWKRSFSVPSQTARRKRFIPATRAPQNAHSSQRDPGQGYKQSLLLQAFCAGALVFLCAVMVHHPSKFPLSLSKKIEAVFQKDDTAQVAPTIDAVFSDMHLSKPVFGANTTIKLHDPLKGTVVADYSHVHPEIWIAGTAGEPVMAAGSGTVTMVVKSGSTELIKIDNGTFGTSIYAGLQTANVKANEYVSSGEVVGKLPNTPSHPELRFSLIQNGNYVNPHKYISFSGTSKS